MDERYYDMVVELFSGMVNVKKNRFGSKGFFTLEQFLHDIKLQPQVSILIVNDQG